MAGGDKCEGGEVIIRISGSSLLSQESRMQPHQPI